MDPQSHNTAGSFTGWSTSKVAANNTTRQYFEHFSGQASSTNTILAASLKEQYPSLKLSILSQVDLLGFAANGFAKYTPLADDANSGLPSSVTVNAYQPAQRRVRGSNGLIAQDIRFGKFHYQWQARDFILYIAHGLDGSSGLSSYTYAYLLSSDEHHSEALVLAAGKWTSSLHEEIWVYDGGYWSKSAELYQSVMKASWDAVILDAQMKSDLINDHLSFFQSEGTYRRLKVPWKRGIIYYGPPGNGKTISIKAMMHTLYDMKPEVPTLYVRSLASFMGPEYAIKTIFSKARQFAPCYLVFEDLDSLVSDSVRSYFLNEVDGLKENDGIFMIGSTNHLERLDPGISRRPSRFDRKYLFPNPNLRERIAYCHFWQAKLKDNKEISFPDKLCDAIAGITSRFSFAYMQEAFVAALLAIARDEKPDGIITAMDVLTVDVAHDWVEVLGGAEDDEDPELEKLVLWREMKKQVNILREGLRGGDGELDADLVSV
ncbi:ATPase (AAA) domain protein [Metarhizium robertsii]|uniref:ATP-dependent Zn protease n=2 Tax=Metarhizium robertsii TaxID=568076 RepID=E9ES93_METRA|nr:ATP-dependent Zn protease [Metarhizium robertsii ARSEF 23]EFZ01610.2 ATP-dependent Zn protease [Metarhizium robertsii ARSEF 23]EXV01447.1 ATPase (AAA) domain protein [Metarhizium robertsii]